MDCPTEERIIRNKLTPMESVIRLDFDLLERILTVTHAVGKNTEVEAALSEIGMEPKSTESLSEVSAQPQSRQRIDFVILGISGALAAAAELLAWSFEAQGVPHADKNPIVIGLAIAALLLCGRETAKKGWMAIRTFTLNINFLVSLAVIGAAALGQWPEAAMAAFLFAVAETIESLSLTRARDAVRALTASAPSTAEVLSDCGSYHETKVDLIALSDVIRVKPGQKIPLDGVVTEGLSTVSQAAITGESMPVEKTIGDSVFAGTLNQSGTFLFSVTATQSHTKLAQIVQSVKDAQQHRAPTERFIDKFAAIYTPTIVILALLYAFVPSLLFHLPLLQQVHKALVLLVVACPCALVISTPVTVVSGLTTATRLGLLVRGGVYLETARSLKRIAFDKTGTLTIGHPTVTDVIPLTERAPEELLHLAASLNAASEHPIASAIVARCQGTHRCTFLPVEEFQALIGRGVTGRVGGTKHLLGNHRLTHESGVCSPRVEEILSKLESEGKTAIVLADEFEALAVIGVADALRPEAIAALRELHLLGIETELLSGDNKIAVAALAKIAGLDSARGELLPNDKSERIIALRESGPIGMVGDGINDGPALAEATIGFAMGRTGTDAALEIADVVLLREDLRLIPALVRLSRRVSKTLTQNIAISIGLKLIVFVLAIFGNASLPLAIFADVGACLIVVANGLRLLRSVGV
jgi:Zn2+/Cd2+-exporting ATPase